MRTLEGHVVNPINDTIKITVLDEPGQGGANHVYRVDLRPSDGKSAGRVAYDAYAASTGWKSLVSGADLPQWELLKAEIQMAWEASAIALHQRELEHAVISFQNGPIGEAGANGITHEVLLEILIDRLTGFQAGPYANHFNAGARGYLLAARECLLSRTRERMARGVEGLNKV